jgi:hypothetical protein
VLGKLGHKPEEGNATAAAPADEDQLPDTIVNDSLDDDMPPVVEPAEAIDRLHTSLGLSPEHFPSLRG